MTDANHDQPGARLVCIGISRYSHTAIQNPKYARSDAELVYHTVREYGFKIRGGKESKLLVDGEATAEAIRSAVRGDSLEEQRAGEILYLYFAGTGVFGWEKSDPNHSSSRAWLLPSDADPQQLADTAISFAELGTLIQESGAANALCFFDAGFGSNPAGRSHAISPQIPQPMRSVDFFDGIAAPDRLIMSAAAPYENALETNELRHGLFTHHLVRGIRGAADHDGDGLVAIDELCGYVHKKLIDQAKNSNLSGRPLGHSDLHRRIVVSAMLGEKSPPRVSDSADKSDVKVRHLFLKANIAYKSGDLKTVHSLMEQILQIDPGHAKAGQTKNLIERKWAKEAVAPEPAGSAKAASRPPVETPREETPVPYRSSAAAGRAAADAAEPINKERPGAAPSGENRDADRAADLFEKDVIGARAGDSAQVSARLKAPDPVKRGIRWGRWLLFLLVLLVLALLAGLIFRPLNQFLPTALVEYRELLPHQVLRYREYTPGVLLSYLDDMAPASGFDGYKRTTRKLRVKGKALTVDSAKIAMLANGFYERHWNSAGKGAKHDYKEEKNMQVISDYTQLIMWEASGSAHALTFDDAIKYTDELNKDRFAGYSDWRLPTLEEAMSLVTPLQENGDLHIDYRFGSKQRRIWTADAEGGMRQWVVYYYDGYADPGDRRYQQHYVRAVR